MDPRAPGRPRVGPRPPTRDQRWQTRRAARALEELWDYGTMVRRQPSCDCASPTRGTRQVAELTHNVTARREGEPVSLSPTHKPAERSAVCQHGDPLGPLAGEVDASTAAC